MFVVDLMGSQYLRSNLRISLKENETSIKKSQPYVLEFDNDKIKWTFCLDLRPVDGNSEVLNLWITSQNSLSLTIESDVIVKDRSDKPFIKQVTIIFNSNSFSLIELCLKLLLSVVLVPCLQFQYYTIK
jgi:hypothetical protein